MGISADDNSTGQPNAQSGHGFINVNDILIPKDLSQGDIISCNLPTRGRNGIVDVWRRCMVLGIEYDPKSHEIVRLNVIRSSYRINKADSPHDFLLEADDTGLETTSIFRADRVDTLPISAQYLDALPARPGRVGADKFDIIAHHLQRAENDYPLTPGITGTGLRPETLVLPTLNPDNLEKGTDFGIKANCGEIEANSPLIAAIRAHLESQDLDDYDKALLQRRLAGRNHASQSFTHASGHNEPGTQELDDYQLALRQAREQEKTRRATAMRPTAPVYKRAAQFEAGPSEMPAEAFAGAVTLKDPTKAQTTDNDQTMEKPLSRKQRRKQRERATLAAIEAKRAARHDPVMVVPEVQDTSATPQNHTTQPRPGNAVQADAGQLRDLAARFDNSRPGERLKSERPKSERPKSDNTDAEHSTGHAPDKSVKTRHGKGLKADHGRKQVFRDLAAAQSRDYTPVFSPCLKRGDIILARVSDIYDEASDLPMAKRPCVVWDLYNDPATGEIAALDLFPCTRQRAPFYSHKIEIPNPFSKKKIQYNGTHLVMERILRLPATARYFYENVEMIRPLNGVLLEQAQAMLKDNECRNENFTIYNPDHVSVGALIRQDIQTLEVGEKDVDEYEKYKRKEESLKPAINRAYVGDILAHTVPGDFQTPPVYPALVWGVWKHTSTGAIVAFDVAEIHTLSGKELKSRHNYAALECKDPRILEAIGIQDPVEITMNRVNLVPNTNAFIPAGDARYGIKGRIKDPEIMAELVRMRENSLRKGRNRASNHTGFLPHSWKRAHGQCFDLTETRTESPVFAPDILAHQQPGPINAPKRPVHNGLNKPPRQDRKPA